MFQNVLENVRKKCPLIHNITNYVTANDCANVVLACGASPIMADEKDEVADITAICAGLNINMGTISKPKIESMLIAGKKANELHHPIVLDPVGVGISKLRRDTAMQFLQEIQFTVIRGNVSEIKKLALGIGTEKGVDAADCITEENMDEIVAFAKVFAKETEAIVVLTGAVDIVADGQKAYCIRNGHPMMSSITGTGCQLSAMIAAYISANPENLFIAVVAAVSAMGYAGEIAYARLSELDGNATYRTHIIDAIYNMTTEMLEKGAKYEVR